MGTCNLPSFRRDDGHLKPCQVASFSSVNLPQFQKGQWALATFPSCSLFLCQPFPVAPFSHALQAMQLYSHRHTSSAVHPVSQQPALPTTPSPMAAPLAQGSQSSGTGHPAGRPGLGRSTSFSPSELRALVAAVADSALGSFIVVHAALRNSSRLARCAMI